MFSFSSIFVLLDVVVVYFVFCFACFVLGVLFVLFLFCELIHSCFMSRTLLLLYRRQQPGQQFTSASPIKHLPMCLLDCLSVMGC